MWGALARCLAAPRVRRSLPGMPEWISQSEAARRLSATGDPLTQQQVSRYLERWPEIPRRIRGPGRPVLVDFAALSAHRLENIRVQERSTQQTPVAHDATAELHALRTRERRAVVEIAEQELAKLRDDLIPRAAVLCACDAARQALATVHTSTREARVIALEAARDARMKVLVLGEQDIAIQAGLSAALQALATAE
jgi:hypothetical protein